jgi:HPt (histidine-containing phosphotransfer) domain-containing protein
LADINQEKEARHMPPPLENSIEPLHEKKTSMNNVDQKPANDPAFASNVGTKGAILASPPLAAGLGSDRIKSRLAGNPKVMRVIPEFVGGLPGEVDKLADLLKHNDLAALQTVVHQLRGSSGGYGFDAVTAPATKAEESIKAGSALESITAEIKSLIDVVRRIDGYDESKESVTTRTTVK